MTTAAPAARGLSVIGLCAAGFTALSTALPGPEGLDRTGVLLVCAVTTVCALAMRLPLWARLGDRTTLVMVPVALAMIAAHNSVSAVDPFRYGVFYLLLFVWIGMYHRPGTALLAAVPTVASYAWPLVAGGNHEALSTAVYAVPMYVLVGEILSRRSTALGEAQSRLHRLAHVDSLTGLPNRRAFLDLLAGACDGDATRRPAVAFLDLDRFKAVNDRLGHAAGDALLVSVSSALASALRRGDVAARLAGDEFAVLLAGPLDRADAEAIGRRLRTAIGVAAHDAAPDVGVAASIGIAWCAGRPEEVLHRADEAMYAAKRNGRGVVLDDAARCGTDPAVPFAREPARL
jgi:diguanylate cyclase (GGDEF)-like protein